MEINENAKIGKIIGKYPETIPVFEKYGLGCVGCPAAGREKIRDIAEIHSIDLASLIEDIKKAINKTCRG